MGTQQEGIFLPGLARAFQGVDISGDISTLQFAKACDAILPVFDRLGELYRLRCYDLDGSFKNPVLLSSDYEPCFCPTRSPKHVQAQSSLLQSQSLLQRYSSIANTSSHFAGQAFAFAQKDMVHKVNQAYTYSLMHQCLIYLCLAERIIGAGLRQAANIVSCCSCR